MTMTDRGVQTLNREGAKPGVSRAFIFVLARKIISPSRGTSYSIPCAVVWSRCPL